MEKQKYYHVTKAFLKPGDLLLPGIFGGTGKNYNSSTSTYIYFTSSPAPHFTVLVEAIRQNWSVYEVKPQGNVELGWWDDYISNKPAVVVKRVGNARGLAKKHKFKKKEINRLEELKDLLKDKTLSAEEREEYLREKIHIKYKSSSAYTRHVIRYYGYSTKK